MPVELITERSDIEPNHVFIIPEQRDLHVLDEDIAKEIVPIARAADTDSFMPAPEASRRLGLWRLTSAEKDEITDK